MGGARSWVGRLGLLAATVAVLLFMYFPLSLVIAYAFNTSGTQSWPPAGFTLRWIEVALANTGLIEAFKTSLFAALGATVVAVVLGTLASLAVARYRFFGRETVSFLLLLPISLPGVVTGMALSTTFATTDFPLGFYAIVDRPRDVLRRARLQQRAGPRAARSPARSRRRRPTWARTRSRLSGS